VNVAMLDFFMRNVDCMEFNGGKVLEVGSKFVNGSVRPLIEGFASLGSTLVLILSLVSTSMLCYQPRDLLIILVLSPLMLWCLRRLSSMFLIGGSLLIT